MMGWTGLRFCRLTVDGCSLLVCVGLCVCVCVFVCGVCVVCGNVYGNGGKADGAESVAVVLLGLCVLTKCMRWRRRQAAAATSILSLVVPKTKMPCMDLFEREVYDSKVAL